MPPRCLCFVQIGPYQQLGGSLPGTVSLATGSQKPGLQHEPPPSPAFCTLPEQQPAAPVVPEDPHHPLQTWVVARMEMGHCDQQPGPSSLGGLWAPQEKWGLSFCRCFCSSNCCAKIKAFVCLFSPTFLISLCAGLPYSPSSTFNL